MGWGSFSTRLTDNLASTYMQWRFIMKHSSVYVLALSYGVVFLALQVSSFAQVLTGRTQTSSKATIVALTPKTVSLRAGGESATVTVEGNYLETVLSVQAIKDGRLVKEITTKLVQPWPTSRKLEIHAEANAPLAKGYQLQVIGKVGTTDLKIDIPLTVFSLEVVRGLLTLAPIAQQPPLVSPPLNVMMPDLVVDAIRIVPPNPTNGQDPGFLVYATIRNKGNKDAFLPKGWHLATSSFSGWRPSDFYGFPPTDNTTLVPGAALEILVYNYRSREQAVVGTWTVTVRADPDKQIPELDEGNNEKSVQVTVSDANPPPPPSPVDLIITNLSLDPAEATIAGNFKLVAVIKNQGGTAVTWPKGYAILDEQGGHLVKEQIFDNITLQPGETKEFRCTPKLLQVGTFTWTVRVDPDDKVSESNETNNTKQMQITVK